MSLTDKFHFFKRYVVESIREVFVHMEICVRVDTYVRACIQRSERNLRCYSSSTVYIVFEMDPLTGIELDRLSAPPLEFTCLCLLSTGMTSIPQPQ